MTREQYEEIVRAEAEKIEASRDRMRCAYWDRLETIEGVEPPEVEGVDPEFTGHLSEDEEIAEEVTDRAEVSGEEWSWVLGYYM